MRSRLGLMIFAGIMCLGITSGTSHLLAKHYGAGTPWPKKKSAAQTQPTTVPFVATTSPVSDDSVARAQVAMLTAEARAKRKFEKMPEWIIAQEVVSKARSGAQAAGASVGSSVQNQSEYINAVSEVTRDEEKLQQARENGGGVDAISAAASTLMAARSTLSVLESRSWAANPVLEESKEKLANANLAIEQLRKREAAFVQADPDWQAAAKAYEDARARGKTASAEK